MEILTSKHCSKCKALKIKLKSKCIKYREYDITDNFVPEYLLPAGVTTLPVIYLDGWAKPLAGDMALQWAVIQ